MLKYRFARPLWRAIFVGVSSLFVAAILAAPSSAQLRASWDANAAVAQFEAPPLYTGTATAPVVVPSTARWLGQRAMGAAVRYTSPFAQLNAGGVLRDGDVSSRATGGVSLWLGAPAWKGLRVSVTAEQRHVPNDAASITAYDPTILALRMATSKVPTWQSTNAINVAYARNNAGVWLRASQYGGAATSDSVSSYSVGSGYTYQYKNMVLGLSITSRNARNRSLTTPAHLVTLRQIITGNDTTYQPVYDSNGGKWQRWSDAGTSFGWGSGRLAFDATLNARPKMGNLRSTVWGEATGTAAISSRLAFVAGLRAAQPLPGIANYARRVASFGLRVAPPAFWRAPTPAPVRSVSRAFMVQQSAPGQYVISISVPNARTVELAGDFTGWESVSMRQVSASRWEIRVPVTAGSHRCNIRIDGAEWVPPPGVPSVNDEFNGRVGLFVAE